MTSNRILDPNVIRAWSERCVRCRRVTLWLWPLSLLSTLGPIFLVVGFGAVAFIPAFALFAAGLLAIGVALSIQTPLLFCPHCGHRPLLLLTREHPSLLSAEYCRNCHYWLRQPA